MASPVRAPARRRPAPDRGGKRAKWSPSTAPMFSWMCPAVEPRAGCRSAPFPMAHRPSPAKWKCTSREMTRPKLWQELAEGQTREGVVRSIKDFGAFVDLGGVDGLLHVSEMSWTRVQNAAEIVQQGQKVKVVILKIDRERRKVSLGLKQLTASP